MTNTTQTSESEAGHFAARIARGAEFLDDHAPDWRQRIDLRRLAMDRCTRCVLGQLSGVQEEMWERVLDEFGINGYQAAELGFDLYEDVDYTQTWDALTDAWAEYIEATR